MQKTNLLLLSLLIAMTSACGGGGGSSSSDSDTDTTDPVVDNGNNDGNDTPEEPEQPGASVASYESAKQLCADAEVKEGAAIIEGASNSVFTVKPTEDHHSVSLFDYQGTVCVEDSVAGVIMENFTGNVYVNGDVPLIQGDMTNANVYVYGSIGRVLLMGSSTVHFVYDEISTMDVESDSEGSTFTKRSN